MSGSLGPIGSCDEGRHKARISCVQLNPGMTTPSFLSPYYIDLASPHRQPVTAVRPNFRLLSGGAAFAIAASRS